MRRVRGIILILWLLAAAAVTAQEGAVARWTVQKGADGTIEVAFDCPWQGRFDTVAPYLALPSLGMPGAVGAAGAPALPSAARLVVLPRGSRLGLAQWRADGLVSASTGGLRLMPRAPSVSKDEVQPPYGEADKAIYSSTACYRVGPTVELEHLGTMGADEVYLLRVAPFAYSPAEGTVQCSTRVAATLHATLASGAEALPAVPKRLLVVSRPQFREGLQPFVQWKRQEGYDVVELYATTHRRDSVKALVSPYFAASPLQSVEPWPTHLLLVGDVEQLQAYIGGTDRPEGLGAHVTDLYYAEHTGDYLPDAQVGRWPVGDTAELRAVVEKTLRYEQGLGLDTAVLRRVLLVAGAESSNPAPVTTNGQVNYVGSELVLTHPGIDTVCFHNPQSASQGPAIVQQIAAGASILNFTAHCNEAGWTSPQLRFASVDTLVGSQPLFYINNCCKSNDYSATGFGELLLRKADGGAVGVIGATNSTLWSEDYYWAVGPKYPLSVNPQYDSLRPGAFDRWTGRLGGVATAGALLQAGNLAVSASGSPYSRFYWEIYCLLGDPSMRPYVGVPAQAMLSAADTVEAGGTTLTVTATPGATVSAVQDSVLLGTATASATGSATLSLRQSMAVGRLLVTATGAALLPAVDTVVATAPQRGLALGHPAATDSTVHFTLANLGADTLGAVAVTLQQDSVDLAIGAPLVVGPLAIGPLAPHAVVPVSLPYSVAMAGPRPQWHATLVATADTLRCAVALGRALVPDYPTVALDLLDTDGQTARSLEAGGSYRLSVAVAGPCDSVGLQLQALPSGLPLDTLFTVPDSTTHLRITTRLHLGTWSDTTVRYLVAGRLREGFESGPGCLPWRMGGTRPWQLDSTVHRSGRYSLRNGAIAHGQTSDLAIDLLLPHTDTVSFWSRPSSEPQYDRMLFFIDGRQVYENWGEDQWSQKVYDLTPGRHTLLWRYVKDASHSEGSDCVWIDDLRLPLSLWDSVYGCTDSDSPLAIEPVGVAPGAARLYPNPAAASVVVDCHDGRSIELVDLYGRLLYSAPLVDATTRIDTRRLPAGLYIVVLHTADHTEYHKLTIQR